MCLTDRAGAILRHHTHSSQVKDTTVTAHWSAIGNGGGGEGEGEAREGRNKHTENPSTLTWPSSNAPYEPGEATTRVPSVAYRLAVTK